MKKEKDWREERGKWRKWEGVLKEKERRKGEEWMKEEKEVRE